jgi:hypothetical protein
VNESILKTGRVSVVIENNYDITPYQILHLWMPQCNREDIHFCSECGLYRTPDANKYGIAEGEK